MLGPAFDQVLNGLVWERTSANSNPDYILLANMDVYGGPKMEANLMVRPQVAGAGPAWSYNAYVNLADDAAFQARSIWAKREYMNMKMLGEVTNDIPAGTEALAGGYVGLDGMYNGARFDGT